METIPLFPLHTVLVPHGRLALQVFEPRYLDLVSRCLKQEHNGGFGVVWLREGSEVHSEDTESDTRLAQLGTFASIVDWDALPNRRLGLVIEGGKKFRLISSCQQSDHLHMAEVQWIEDEPIIPLPEQSEDLKVLLSQLLEHPHIERLKLSPEVQDISSLSFLLTQLLPFPEAIKFELLGLSDPLERLQVLMDMLDEISG